MIETASNDKERLLLLLLWTTGGRVSEVLKLKPMDIVGPDSLRLLNEKQVKAKSPNSYRPLEYKTIYVPESVITELRQYIARHGILRPGYVFQSTRDRHNHMSRTTAWRIVKRIAGERGIYRQRHTKSRGSYITPCYTHLWRHGMAVNLIEQGVSLPIIQHQLGHRSIETTSIYAKVSDPLRQKTIKGLNF